MRGMRVRKTRGGCANDPPTCKSTPRSAVCSLAVLPDAGDQRPKRLCTRFTQVNRESKEHPRGHTSSSRQLRRRRRKLTASRSLAPRTSRLAFSFSRSTIFFIHSPPSRSHRSVVMPFNLLLNLEIAMRQTRRLRWRLERYCWKKSMLACSRISGSESNSCGCTLVRSTCRVTLVFKMPRFGRVASRRAELFGLVRAR